MPAKSKSVVAPVPEIRNGVFFEVQASLPRGRHNLPPEQVAAAQRERILAAATELLAAKGYKSFGAIEIAKRAGVSLKAFYDNFKNKEECVFAGYEQFIKVLLKRMTGLQITGVERTEIVHNIISSYLETLQSDLVVARAYQVEIDALGVLARERRRKSLTLFATFLQEAVRLSTPGKKVPLELTWSAYLGVVYAIRQLASDALDAEPSPNLNLLSSDAEVWLKDLFRLR